MATHEVENQAPPLAGYNVFEIDAPLREAVEREGAGWAFPLLSGFGARCGSEEVIRWGFQANENPPVLLTHDRYGHRRDEVEFHPAYHHLMRLSIEAGIHSLPWESGTKGAHVARAALLYLATQADAGHTCPVSMTYAAIPALRREPAVAAQWEPMILRRSYDPAFRPAAAKSGVTIGMAMTEKQGGSDVRANSTRAEADGVGYRITGHKWFCSAPMCDAFLVLAQAPGGLTCFLMPRWQPDGSRNRFHLQRLKNKLGNRSNASSEVEFENAWAWRIGPEGRGVATIIEMVNHTRLDCVVGAAGLMRQALTLALHHAAHRRAFGKLLSEQPLMRNVLADLSIECEAATAMAMRLARAFDRGEPFGRIAAAVSKFWLGKRCPAAVGEALECLGGNGYVEDSGMPRLFRESPLLSIWEGSGNVIALDILRAIGREPESFEALRAEIRESPDSRVLRLAGEIDEMVAKGVDEQQARMLGERLAIALQASLLTRFSPEPVADAFVRTRVEQEGGRVFGTLPGDSGEILRTAERNATANALIMG